MDFNQVRYFLALADTLNFTRAAERCYVSQPALTQGIKRLEVELDGELVNRDGRYTELTDLGRAVRTHFEQINRTHDLVRITAKAITSGEVAELNVGVMCTVGPRQLVSLLTEFQTNNPMISVVLHDVTHSAIADLLLTGALDAVLCARHSPGHPRLRYFSLFDEAMVIAFPVGHELARFDDVPFSELPKYPYIERLHCEFRQETHDFLKGQDIELNVVIRSEREDWIQSLVRDGAGITMMPRNSLMQPDLDFRPLTYPGLTRTVEVAVVDGIEMTAALEKLVKESLAHTWP